jgi:CRP-like cAMP-binding protein
MTDAEFATQLQKALQRSMFARLGRELISDITNDATYVALPSGGMLYEQGGDGRVHLVLDGIVRLYIAAPDGRQATATYLRSGGVVGLFSLAGARPAVNAQALPGTHVAELRVDLIERLARTNARFAWELEQEVASLWASILGAMGINTFGTIRQRVVRHLVNLATLDESTGQFTAKVTHQQIADSAGSVRDVVGRVLRSLRDGGQVELRRNAIVLLDPAGLKSELATLLPNETKVLLTDTGAR